MASFFTLITATGQAKIAAAIAAGTAVSLTHMAVGDGNGNPITPAESMTALVRERYRAAVTNIRQHETNSNWLVAELVIPATVGGWTVHEVGLFDTSGALIAIGSFPATYKPVLTEGSTRELVARIILEVSDTAAITLIVDPTIVMATRQWVADNFSVGKQLPGGTTGQFLRKKSDASGDVEWSSSFGQATTEAAGVVELATNAEAVAGTDTDRAVTPAALAAAIAASISDLAGVAYTDHVQAFTRQQYSAAVERTGASGSQALDLDLHQLLIITATGALAFAAPSNLAVGKSARVHVYSAAAVALTYDAAYAASLAFALPVSTTAGKWLILEFYCHKAGALMLTGMNEEA